MFLRQTYFALVLDGRPESEGICRARLEPRNRGPRTRRTPECTHVFQDVGGSEGYGKVGHLLRVVKSSTQPVNSGLEKEMQHVQAQQERSGLRRHIEAGQDLIDVRGCYRRVATLHRELQVS